MLLHPAAYTYCCQLHSAPSPLKVFFLKIVNKKNLNLDGGPQCRQLISFMMSASVVMGLVWLLTLAGLGDSQRPQALLPA